MKVAPSVAMPVTGVGRGAAARVGEVVGHAGHDVGLFAAKIGFQLDHGRAPRHVDAPTVVEQIKLVGDFVNGAPKPSRSSSVTWPRRASGGGAGHGTDDFRQPILAPTAWHCPLTSQPGTCRCGMESLDCEHGSGQADLFAQDDAERNKLSEPQRAAIRSRLEATLARLEATATFPWEDPLDAVHEENRFQRETELLG